MPKRYNTSSQSQTSQADSKKSGFGKSLLIFLFSFVLAVVVFGGSIGGVFAYFAQDLPQVVNVDDRELAQSTKIFDRTGETLLYQVSGKKNRTVVGEEDIPQVVREAFMAAEDGNFYDHWGIQPRAIARAALVNIREGKTVQGGSTITQQFVKNALLTDERTYVRKLREAILAIQLELNYSKDEIFTMYLNEIPFGSNIYGIEAAAETYFGKSADELTVHEAATLATLPRAPSYYSPYGANREALKARQQAILNIMERKGFITQKELENNLDKKISVEPFDQDIKAPHFVFYVRDILSQKLGQQRLQKGGLRVTTSLDYELHQKAQEIVKKHVEEEVESYGGSNAALGAVDPKTGEILTMVGSRDYYSDKIDGQVNILSSLQSPGSSMKPFVYGSGFEKGYNPQTKMFDVPTDFGGGYEPENFDGGYRGPVSIRTALVRSLNIPAVKALHLTGIGDYFQFARDLGISNYTSSVMQEASLSAAIGGASLKPIEEIGAYGTLADGGMHDPLTPIKSVKTNQGTVPEPFKDRGEERRVIEEQAALQVTDILSEASGVPSSMQISGVDVASKTGTSQDFRDSLTMGYTTNLAAGVWTGNNDNSPMNEGAYGSKVAAPMWKDFMQTALDHLETSPGRFEEPVPADTDKPMLNGEHVYKETVKVNRLTGKRVSENTPPQLVEERTYKQVHNILHYVNKKNPLGPIPDNPELDPQYNQWEPPVKEWAKENGFKNPKTPPTEEDTIYDDGKSPSIQVTNLSDGFNIKGNQTSSFKVKNSISAERDIEKVEFLIDESVVKTVRSSPYNATLSVPGKGAHTLTVRVVDAYFEKSETTLDFNVEKDEEAPRILNFQASDGPEKYTLKAKVREENDGSGLQKVEFWDKNQNKKLTTRSQSGTGVYSFEYTYDPDTPNPPYKFYVKTYDNAGNTANSDSLKRPK